MSENYHKWCCVVDYVWIDGIGNLRSKCRVLNSYDNIPDWDYDGSSTGQADGNNSEIILKPRRIFNCPFRRGYGIVAMCDCYTPDGEPALYNNRFEANKIFDQYLDTKPWYGLEQEYFILDNKKVPIGFNPSIPQGQYYCSVGSENAFGRKLAEIHLEHCLYAGLQISGINAEVAPGQWEFQIGPVEGIDAADQLWIARYFLEKLSEEFGVIISYHPKHLKCEWNGSGCHTNFSTEVMRNLDGITAITKAISKLEEKHDLHMKYYGSYNEERMTGQNETSNYDKFSYGVGSRNTSVRIPTLTWKNNKGYFEDRRPASNCDPYLVTSLILSTVMCN